jgi:adenine deaminase
VEQNKSIKGNIYNPSLGEFQKGTLFYNERIENFIADDSISEMQFVLPGLIDAHVHIESSMLSPLEYSVESLKHGVVACISDPHEIANVCGVDGIDYMVYSASQTPMKIFTGAPSCVPATDKETSGGIIGVDEIDELFKNNKCSNLAEMMNYPGVLFDDPFVLQKIDLAIRYNKCIDGHAPLLTGEPLKKYISKGITTDHECTTLKEALEKIDLGMKIMLRESSASKDFDHLDQLIALKPNAAMFCTDDCHPDDLQKGYIDKLFQRAVKKGYSIENICKAASINSIKHYNLPVGKLEIDDCADFIVVNNLSDFKILKTIINGEEVFDGENVFIEKKPIPEINKFFINNVSLSDLKVDVLLGNLLNVIQVIPDSLTTKHLIYKVTDPIESFESSIQDDILKIVVVNRYTKAKPSLGFINGFGLKKGAIGGSVAHDSHNIIVVGTDDQSILAAIRLIQQEKGGLVVINENEQKILPLPIGGLMSDKDCTAVAREYSVLNGDVKEMGSRLKAPFMTLAFMALLVIPELKIGDKGLFDVNKFSLIDLKS